MNQGGLDALLTILRYCAQSEPNPWYPSKDGKSAILPRNEMDALLDQLRLGGLLRLTDWVPGSGQGYALTPAGKYVLESPRELAHLQTGPPQPDRKGTPEQAPNVRDPFLNQERYAIVRDALLNPAAPTLTIALILLNVIWFLVGFLEALQAHIPANTFLFASSPVILERTGALRGDFIVQGQWWRLLSCCFVHIGLVHLGMNMWSLYIIGKIQESMWGRLRLLAIYLIAGLGGSCAMVINNPNVLGAGASGALFGLMSSLTVWIIFNRKYIGRQATAWLRRLGLVFVLNMFISSLPGISASAHFGGAAVGLVAAVLFMAQRFRHGILSWLSLAGVLALPVICIGAVLEAQKRDERWDSLDFQRVRMPLVLEADEEAVRIKQQKIEPLQGLGVLSVDDVQHVLDASKEARASLDRGIDVLSNAGPYRDNATEAVREKDLATLQRKKTTLEKVEMDDFAGPLVGDIRRQALRAIQNEALKQLKLAPQQRDPQAVAAALAILEQQQAEMAKAAELLNNAGPFSTKTVETRREYVCNLLAAQEKLFALFADRLRQGADWTPEKQREFDRQFQQLNKVLDLGEQFQIGRLSHRPHLQLVAVV